MKKIQYLLPNLIMTNVHIMQVKTNSHHIATASVCNLHVIGVY